MTKRHAKPTAQALAERSYRHVLAFKRTLLNQMAHIRLDIATARREDREHMKTLIDHCARLLREKETLQRQLYAVREMKEATRTVNPWLWKHTSACDTNNSTRLGRGELPSCTCGALK